MKNRAVVFLLSLFVAPLCSAQAGVGKSGSKIPPGCKSPIKYKVVSQKILVPGATPAKAGKDVSAWVEFSNETANPCSFVFCFMLDLKLDEVTMDKYVASSDGTKWTCKKMGTASAKPNFHFGCTQITVPAYAGQKGKHGGQPDPDIVTAFKDPNDPDKTKLKSPVQMSRDFSSDLLGVVYMDMLKDLPVDPSCNLCKADQFLVPEAPANKGDWVNTWVGGTYFTLDNKLFASLTFPQGNWVTMALASATFPATMVGTVSGAPPGAAIGVSIPGQEPLSFTASGDAATCRGQDLAISAPYSIANGGMNPVGVSVTLPSGPCGLLTESQAMQFTAQVLATAGGPIYLPGDFMLGIDLSFVQNTQPPVLTEHSIVTDTTGNVTAFVRASGATSYAAGAQLAYSVNGGPLTTVAMAVLDESRTAGSQEIGFATGLGHFADGTRLSLQALISNEAGLSSTTTLDDFLVRSARSAPVSFNSASYAPGRLAAGSLATMFGGQLATASSAAPGQPPPTILAGAAVKVIDSGGSARLAALYFVSPGQINFVVPPATTAGPAVVQVSSGDGGSSLGTLQGTSVSPGVFSADSSGRGVAAAFAVKVNAAGQQDIAAVFQCTASAGCQATPVDLGGSTDEVYLVLFGTGFRFAQAPQSASATIGGEPSEITYLGPQATFAGLDQMNIRIPRSLQGRGTVPVALTIDGVQANSVNIAIR